MAFISKTWVDDQIVYAEDMNRIEQGISKTDALLREKTNPNLLDNAYFGNPIDQRGGYVVPPGVTGYSDKTLQSVAGDTVAYRKVAERTSTYTAFITGAGAINYAAPGSEIRGYTGTEYGIDRWYFGTDGGVYLIEDGYIRIIRSGSWVNFYQTVGNFADLKGKTVTVSALIDGNLEIVIGVGGSLYPFSVSHIGSKSIVSRTFAVPDDSETLRVIFQSKDNNGANIYAAKLELGTTQTLAHQDADGNWVLNAIPNYSEEFLKCIQSTADPTDEYANKVIYSTGNKPTPADIGAAPAGFGWGDEWPGLLSPETLAYSEYCARVDGVLDTMSNSTSKLVYARGPNETRQYYDAGNIIAVLSRVSASDASLTGLSVSPPDTRKGLWRMIKSNGIWDSPEWIIAPMILGVEYRTTERYLGKPVYVKATDCGALPGNGSTKNVQDPISNIEHLVSYGGDIYNAAGTDSLPYYGGENRRVEVDAAWSGIGLWNVGIGETDVKAIVWRKYTKKTD